MTTNSTKPIEAMQDGYYWAKLIDSARWQPVWVTGPYVGIIDHDTKEYSHTVSDFTFGPRIEEPRECLACQHGDAGGHPGPDDWVTFGPPTNPAAAECRSPASS